MAELRGFRSPAGLLADDHGVVYVEFLVAFVPVFILFLGTCQVALLTTARIVARQAAFSAVRSAIVVLEEPPSAFRGAKRGVLSSPPASTNESMQALLAGIAAASGSFSAPSVGSSGGSSRMLQHGARMVPIRTSAYTPLLALAPRETDLTRRDPGSLGRSLPTGIESRLGFALGYTQAASVVTLHTEEGSDALATEPVGSTASLTVRVTYLYPCGVPLVRALLCATLETLLGHESRVSVLGIPISVPGTPLARRFGLAEAPGALQRLAPKDARFAVVDVEATLPNQGAGYYQPTAGGG